MRKNRIKMKNKIYPVIWSGIIIASIYLLIRFATLSFSDNIGQADAGLADIMFSNLYSKVIGEGYSLISYTENEEEQLTFPVSLVSDQFAISKFTTDNSVLTAKAQENSYLQESIDTMADADAIQTVDSDETHLSLGYDKIDSDYLSKEYILTNGSVINGDMADESDTGISDDGSDQLQLGYTQGDIYYEESEDGATSDDDKAVEAAGSNGVVSYTLKQLEDINFLVRNFYTVDSSTKVTEKLFDADVLLGKDMTIKQTNDKPQILIYHTHTHEAYSDSRPNNMADTVVGVGDYLTEILEEDYGYNVIHDTTVYDIVDGKENRNIAYNNAEAGLEKILNKNPSIEVVIDLHRDSGDARITVIDGKETAKIMLFNGLSRDQNGPITYLDNPNLQDNLAFSLQIKLKSLDLYPALFVKNYLKSYRFNMHVRPKCLLMELGTVNNTLEQAKNAMVPFAEVLDAVLQGK